MAYRLIYLLPPLFYPFPRKSCTKKQHNHFQSSCVVFEKFVKTCQLEFENLFLANENFLFVLFYSNVCVCVGVGVRACMKHVRKEIILLCIKTDCCKCGAAASGSFVTTIVCTYKVPM